MRITSNGKDFAAAIIDGGNVVTFGELRERSRNLLQSWPERPLVFLEAINSSACLELYFACLANRFPVFLVPSAAPALLEPLTAGYDPNIIVTFPSGRMVTTVRHQRPLAIHPVLSVILSTSGSTGSPKLVKLSASNIDANASSICDYLGITLTDRAITSLPFSYSYGMSVVNSHWHAGGSILVNDASPMDAEFWSKFVDGNACSFAGVPYTFEMLSRLHSWASTPGLRYVTQAGGRLAPELVREMATLGARHDWDFVVMYGQTEASPRMAYLPAKLAVEHPDCIGRAIPGGTLTLIDEAGATILDSGTTGELRYAGPNVMMGYATSVADLVTDGSPEFLVTGDLAVRTEKGLFRIVGRTNRIANPFGIRIDLDDLERRTRDYLPGSLCVANDTVVVVASTTFAPHGLREQLSSELRLPVSAIQVLRLDAIPLLGNGKPDYQSVLRVALAARAKELRGATGERVPRSRRHYLRLAWSGLLQILGFRAAVWSSVEEIFTTFLPGRDDIPPLASFSALAADSLAYVQVSIALEDYLGGLPDCWEDMTLLTLENARFNF